MRNYKNISFSMISCIFTDNSANTNGGGFYNYYCMSSAVTNCTFANNMAYSRGGGIFNYNAKMALTNCILWDNSASDKPDMYNYWTACAVFYSCLSGDGYEGINGNISLDPMFVIGPNGQYYLDQSISPCINTGDPDTVQDILDILSERTTSIDGAYDIGIADMGYHYERN